MALHAHESGNKSERQAEESLQRQVTRLHKLYLANLELSGRLDKDFLFESVLSQAVELVNGSHAELYLYQPGQNALKRHKPGLGDKAQSACSAECGEVVAEKVWATGLPFIANDYEHGEGEKCSAIAGVPIRQHAAIAQESFVGVLAVQGHASRVFTQEDVELLEMFARQAALAINNAHVQAVALSYADRMVALQQFAQALIASLDLASVIGTALTHIQQLFKAARVSLLQPALETGQLCYTKTLVRAEWVDASVCLQPGRGIAAWALEQAAPIVIEDAQKDAHFENSLDELLACPTRALMSIPLLTRESVIGVIEIANSQPGVYTRNDLNDLQAVTPILIMAIDNARLYAELEAERSLLARRVAERTAELSAANAELVKAVRLKDEFLANVSHELRTPLNAILGLSQILCEQAFGPLNDRQLGSLRTIHESGQRLLGIINHILDLSKIEAGKVQLYFAPVVVESLCMASLDSIRQEADGKGLNVSLAMDSHVTTLQADERYLKQILLNLLDNAVKFTQPGGAIGLEVGSDEERQLVCFTVWDTGIGIAAKNMDQLFQPFVQLDGSLSRQYGGTGLGLSLAHRLARLHDGSITVESTLGQGSRFTVSLPWRK